MATQQQMYYKAQQHDAALNRAFLDSIHDPINPLTKADLVALIQRRPESYQRFAFYLNILK